MKHPATDEIVAAPEKFPNGMRTAVDDIRSKGLKWCSR